MASTRWISFWFWRHTIRIRAMGIHYIVLVVIVAVLLLVFAMQLRARREFSRVLADLLVLMPAGLEYCQDDTLVGSPSEEDPHRGLIDDINAYLVANRGVSPNFSIVKDIVERRGLCLMRAFALYSRCLCTMVFAVRLRVLS